jgi:hypothetical protein
MSAAWYGPPCAGRHAALCLVALCLALAGCAGLGGYEPDRRLPTFKDQQLTPADAARSIVIGRTTRTELAALLGPAKTIRFDSGYEVWVYRFTQAGVDGGTGEFVVLFAPAGVVAKTRVRKPAMACVIATCTTTGPRG